MKETTLEDPQVCLKINTLNMLSTKMDNVLSLFKKQVRVGPTFLVNVTDYTYLVIVLIMNMYNMSIITIIHLRISRTQIHITWGRGIIQILDGDYKRANKD